MTDNAIHQTIDDLIKQNDVILFMKGTPEAPMCGFSSVVNQILKLHKVNFHAVNVLESPEIREGIKTYTSWPTIPQLYVKGEFIGGCDIVREMHQSGELSKLLNEKGILSGDI